MTIENTHSTLLESRIEKNVFNLKVPWTIWMPLSEWSTEVRIERTRKLVFCGKYFKKFQQWNWIKRFSSFCNRKPNWNRYSSSMTHRLWAISFRETVPLGGSADHVTAWSYDLMWIFSERSNGTIEICSSNFYFAMALGFFNSWKTLRVCPTFTWANWWRNRMLIIVHGSTDVHGLNTNEVPSNTVPG